MIDCSKFKQEHKEISGKLSDPDVFNDQKRYQTLARRFSFLEKLVVVVSEYEQCFAQIDNLKKTLDDPDEDQEFKDLASTELSICEQKIVQLEEKIENLLFEQETDPTADIIIEIRAAAGGEEAALFAANLYKMYSKYAEKRQWKIEELTVHDTEIGGIKEIVFSVKGHACSSHLKFESGVHRVQRVPVTESGGRIHTSTATVAVLIEPKDVDLEINSEDLKIDTYRASGAGGQHVNKTDSAVRITHLPTGLVVTCQEERSQIKNRAKALRVLKAKLLDRKKQEEESKMINQRRGQIGSGERSEKIRTYNFPERRVTDHRINLTIYRLEAILEGDIDEIVNALIKEERKRVCEAKGLGRKESQ